MLTYAVHDADTTDGARKVSGTCEVSRSLACFEHHPQGRGLASAVEGFAAEADAHSSWPSYSVGCQ